MNFFTSLAQLRNGFGGAAKKTDAQPHDAAHEEERFLTVDDFDFPEPMQRAISKMQSDADDHLDPPEDAFGDDLSAGMDMSAELDMEAELEIAASDTYHVDDVDALVSPETAADKDDPVSLMARVALAAELTEAPEDSVEDAPDSAPEAIAAEVDKEIGEEIYDMVLDAVDADPVVRFLTIDDFDVTRDSIDIEIQRDPADARVLDATEMTLFQAEDGTTGADVVFHLCGSDMAPEVCGTVRLLSQNVISLDDIEITITETAA